MQSSLFEPGRPVIFTRSTCVSVVVYVARKLRPCLSYSRRRDRINLVLWRSLDKGGAGYMWNDIYCTMHTFTVSRYAVLSLYFCLVICCYMGPGWGAWWGQGQMDS